MCVSETMACAAYASSFKCGSHVSVCVCVCASIKPVANGLSIREFRRWNPPFIRFNPISSFLFAFVIPRFFCLFGVLFCFFFKSMSHSLRETKRRARARTHINSIQYTPFASLPYLVFVFFFVFIIIITTFNAYRIAALWL